MNAKQFFKELMVQIIKRFLKEDAGPTVVEYALMLALIVLAAAGTISALGTSISDVFERITTQGV